MRTGKKMVAMLLAAGVVLGLTKAVPAAESGTVPSFNSDAALKRYLRRLEAQRRRERAAQEADDAGEVVVTGTSVSITNTQEQGVDEGGIVKLRGDTLVVLRRGRLFTISLANGGMRAVDAIDAFPPGEGGGGGAWYDEMLLLGDRVIVVGYSYARGGTEINRFRIDDAGRLRFEDAHQLRSNDYYSSRNYASRLIGDRLVFYTPLDLDTRRDVLAALPGLRRWRGDEDARFDRIAGARQVHLPPVLMDGHGAQVDTLHTVTSCDLSAPELSCRATGVLGAPSRTFYVSPRAVYLWISDAWGWRSKRRGARSFLYKLPLDGSEPSAVAARGGPVDQFSFREEPNGTLHVLVRSEGGDDRMWRPELSEGAPALVAVRPAQLGDGGRELPAAAYRALPLADREVWGFRNRFVGEALVYGAGTDEEERATNLAYVAPLDGGTVRSLPIGQDVDRIEVLGRDALVVGSTATEALGFVTLELTGVPRVGGRYDLPGLEEGESRSHAFFFRPDAGADDGASGTLGLPVRREGEDFDLAAMHFLRRDARRLSTAGEVAARPTPGRDDGCVASCVDWYGNSRPIFIGDRVFALMGYELVEGRLKDGRVREMARVDFTPAAKR